MYQSEITFDYKTFVIEVDKKDTHFVVTIHRYVFVPIAESQLAQFTIPIEGITSAKMLEEIANKLGYEVDYTDTIPDPTEEIFYFNEDTGDMVLEYPDVILFNAWENGDFATVPPIDKCVCILDIRRYDDPETN